MWWATHAGPHARTRFTRARARARTRAQVRFVVDHFALRTAHPLAPPPSRPPPPLGAIKRGAGAGGQAGGRGLYGEEGGEGEGEEVEGWGAFSLFD